MTVLYWILVFLFAVGAVLTPGSIGKPRPPLTKGVAIASVVISVLTIFALMVAARS